jgi:DNA-binding CsgD family transcriptional regulator/tetratricopeptide (TPR) repeat protein
VVPHRANDAPPVVRSHPWQYGIPPFPAARSGKSSVARHRSRGKIGEVERSSPDGAGSPVRPAALVSRREAEVLSALADRLSNADIAARLFVSERTVESHVSALLRKLGARNRVELGDLARQGVAASGGRAPLPPAIELAAEAGELIGRHEELSRLTTLWQRARRGRLVVALVTGEAGIGKSRLVAELAVTAHAGGGRVLWGACFDGAQAPYQPFVQAIGADAALLSDDERRRRMSGPGRYLARLFPDLTEANAVGEPLDPASAQSETVVGLRAYLVRAARDRPLVVVLEDVHWGTSTTLDALRQLALASARARVLLLVTARVDSATAGPNGLIAEMSRLPAVERVHLAGLDADDIARLVAPIGSTLAPGQVHVASGGNPLYARELAGFPGAGPLSRGHLIRRPTGLNAFDLVVLDVAAVAGPEFDADVVARVAGLPAGPLGDAFDHCVAAGLIAAQPDMPGRYTFTHALFRSARYDELPAGRRSELHASVAAALADRPSGLASIEEFARHAALAERGRDPGQRTELAERARWPLRRAGDRAMALNDPGAAIRDYQAALDLWPVDDRDRPTLLLALGRALVAGRGEGAGVLAEARDALLASGDRVGAAEAEVLLGDVAWMASRGGEATACFERAETLLVDLPDSVEAATVLAALVRFWMIQGANRRALACAERALALASRFGRTALTADLLISTGPARYALGDVTGIADVDRGVRLAEGLGAATVARGYANQAYLHGLRGELAPADRCRQLARLAAERFGLAELRRWAHAHDAEHRWEAGDWAAAGAAADEFIAGEESAVSYLVTVCLRVRARLRLARGNIAGGLADAAAGLEFARSANHPSNLLVALVFSAHSLADAGRIEAAHVALDDALGAAGSNALLLNPIETAIVMVRLGRRDDYAALAGRAVPPSARWDAGRSIAAGPLAAAADRLDELQYRSSAASVRVLAADELAADGHREAAETQLGAAAAFYRQVAATAYLARCAGLAATITS